MLVSFRTKLEALLVLIVIVLAFLFHMYFTKYHEEKTQRQGVEQLFSAKQQEVVTYKNKYGEVVGRTQGLVLENQTIKQLVKDGNLQFLKEFQDLKGSYKNLEFAYQALSKSVDSLHVKLSDTTRNFIDHKGDTIKFQAHDFKYKDKYAEFNLKQFSPDSASFKYMVEVPVDGVFYWKRKWFLGKKHYFSEITSPNPHVHIPQLLELKVGKK